MTRRRVVVTGAAGYVAQRILDALRERFDLVLLDAVDKTRNGTAVAGLHVVDLTDPNRDRYRPHFRGADAVIHCAFVRPASGGGWKDTSDARFRTEYANIGMAYNVYRTALEEGVRRVLVCSSNHAADYYERLWADDRLELVTPEMPARSDNFYGWSKAAYELLGFVFATGAVDGRKLEVVQWRIGAPRDDDMEKIAPGDLKAMHRALGTWLSARDQAQQAIRAIETEEIADLHGVPFLVIYGISGNTHRFWSLESARAVLGYRPDDDSEVMFADRIAEIVKAPPATAPGPRPWE
jgi:NAD(P)-dependent dehydrogenase (short-subunit alcohol dehydrogenase family)